MKRVALQFRLAPLLFCASVYSQVNIGSAASALRAQEKPTVFLHGEASSGAAWTTASEALRLEFLIAPQLPTIGRHTLLGRLTDNGGYATLGSLATDLLSVLGQQGTYAVVGHGAGGLAARLTVYQAGQAQQTQRIDRLLTLGTPHTGVPLVKAVYGEGGLRRIDEMYKTLWQMIPWNQIQGVDVSDFFHMLWAPAVEELSVAATGVSWRDPRFWFNLAAPLTGDLHPQSPVLADLNAHIGYENVVQRVAIVGQTTNEALFPKALLPILFPSHSPTSLRADAARIDGYRQRIANAYLGVALMESVIQTKQLLDQGVPCVSGPTNLFDFRKCRDSLGRVARWLIVWYAVDNLNVFWRRAIGADGDNSSDAVIPVARQQHPGLGANQHLTLDDAWHALETLEATSLIRTVFSERWGIARRVPPLTNSIERNGYYYSASPSGGQPPYAFLWEWFGRDCGGGGDAAPRVEAGAPSRLQLRHPSMAAPSGGGRIRPNMIVCDWQMFSTAQTVYWTESQRTLRSTVTDAAGSQAVAEYYVP